MDKVEAFVYGNHPEPTRRLVCCRDMAKAFQPGTDNEGWSVLAGHERGGIHIGSRLPPIDFCPWCGKRIDWDWLPEAS